MLKKIIHNLSSPIGLAITNAVLITIVVCTNMFLQAFCRPTPWAQIVLIICFGNTIIYPLLLKPTKLFYLSNFISGISSGVFLYCIIFLGHMNLLGLLVILLMGLGLITYIPHFFVLQLFIRHVYSPIYKLTRSLFLSGLLLFVMAACFFGYMYKNAIVEIENFNRSGFTKLDQNFMTEKILGMYFKYHTEICEYDGWRPPLHEPALIIGLWLNGNRDPLAASFETRIELYKKFFPGQKIKEECSCADAYSDQYHSDPLFKRH